MRSIFVAPGAPSGTPIESWIAPEAQRAMKAHENAVDNLAIFVPAVLTAHVLGISTPATKM